MLSVVKFEEVNGTPTIKLDLPSAQLGDPIGFRLQITRQNGGRHEVLKVIGQFRVTARGIDAASGPPRQLLSVEPIGKPPVWRSVKKPSQRQRRLSPAKNPRTPI